MYYNVFLDHVFCRNRLSGKMIFSHFSQYLSDF
nr:MAG TPA: hypothetical protein [Inoviridae sp.]